MDARALRGKRKTGGTSTLSESPSLFTCFLGTHNRAGIRSLRTGSACRNLSALCLAGAAENRVDLVLNHRLDGVAGRSEVLARIEVARILCEVLADRSRHSETQIGVDVDLAHSHLCGFAEHLLRNTDSVGHLAAVLVDLLDELLRNGGRAVQYDREARQTVGNLLKNVKTELRLLHEIR